MTAVAGDFLHVPKGAIHREGNDGDRESHLVVVRAGRGAPTINVDGPAPADTTGD
jgi:quercetin dioxygenase-like cupin family protein